MRSTCSCQQRAGQKELLNSNMLNDVRDPFGLCHGNKIDLSDCKKDKYNKVQLGHVDSIMPAVHFKKTVCPQNECFTDVSFIITTLIFIFISPRFQPSSYHPLKLSHRASGFFSMQHLSGQHHWDQQLQKRSTTLHPCSPLQGRPRSTLRSSWS